MRPCTQWNIPTGQATDGGVREAWYGNAAARAIRGLTWNDLPGCRECDLRAFCQRCFADAERYAGDALAPYAQACGSALWKYQAERGVQPEIDCESGYCAAVPVGPFRNAGEHRFLVAPTDSLSAPALQRPWLGAAPNPEPAVLPRGFVSLRRGATGPALRVGAVAPSGREV
jgi:hypothetical protein